MTEDNQFIKNDDVIFSISKRGKDNKKLSLEISKMGISNNEIKIFSEKDQRSS